MPKNSLALGLFDPGMTHLHRVGLAGLYMTLDGFEKSAFADVGDWTLDSRRIEIRWKNNPKEIIERIVEKAFSVKDGLIHFDALKQSSISDMGKFVLHSVILRTYLQHGQTRKIEKKEQERSLAFEDKTVVQKYRPLTEYNHQDLKKYKLFDKKGNFKKKMSIAGWLFPGGAVRHVAFSGPTELSSDPQKFICMLFSPVASLYFSIRHKNPDGRFDQRKGAAIVLPHVEDMARYNRCYKRYLDSPVQHLYAESLGDAGLMALTTLNVFDPAGSVQQLDINGCTVITMGTVGWSKQQKSRTGLTRLKEIDKERLNHFSLALRTLSNRAIVTDEKKLFVDTSIVRGHIANNIASGNAWFHGFTALMRTQKLAKLVSYERKGLHQMVESSSWSHGADRLLVEAVHKALRNRYGAMAGRAKQKGESPQFGREYERIRTSLMRAKNQQTLRAELADIFARGHINKTLQKSWAEILPLFTGPDWQRARDLALLALASYAGEGVKEIEKEIAEEEEEV